MLTSSFARSKPYDPFFQSDNRSEEKNLLHMPREVHKAVAAKQPQCSKSIAHFVQAQVRGGGMHILNALCNSVDQV